MSYDPWLGGAGIPARNCSSDAELTAYVRHTMDAWTRKFNTVKVEYGLVNVACSEWALSLHHKVGTNAAFPASVL
jgi:hypothetical protein